MFGAVTRWMYTVATFGGLVLLATLARAAVPALRQRPGRHRTAPAAGRHRAAEPAAGE